MEKSEHLYQDTKHSVVRVGDVAIGRRNPFVLIAGPCAAETEEQVWLSAQMAKDAGAKMLRGGAFKPRTSPYSFQGRGEQGLMWLRDAGKKFDMPLVTEVMSSGQIELVGRYADMFQIGSRNMQNFDLLTEVGKFGKPVLLKRGLSATIEEWLLSAEYILMGGAQVVLCERGIRTFETTTRNTLDISAIPVVKALSKLPIITDPSHAGGRADLVLPLTFASVAVGADGAMVDVHPEPKKALVDGLQALSRDMLKGLAEGVRYYTHAVRNGVAHEC